MTFRFEDTTTPAGKPCLRLHVSGVITAADAEQYAASVEPGAKYHRMLTVSIVARDTQYSSAARRRFKALGQNVGPHASVVASPLARAGINLILRMLGRGDGIYRMFATEPEALAWLDAREE